MTKQSKTTQWRELHEGEIIQEGDEVNRRGCDVNWVRCAALIGTMVAPALARYVYRRPAITPDGIPAGWRVLEQTEEVDASRARLWFVHGARWDRFGGAPQDVLSVSILAYYRHPGKSDSGYTLVPLDPVAIPPTQAELVAGATLEPEATRELQKPVFDARYVCWDLGPDYVSPEPEELRGDDWLWLKVAGTFGGEADLEPRIGQPVPKLLICSQTGSHGWVRPRTSSETPAPAPRDELRRPEFKDGKWELNDYVPVRAGEQCWEDWEWLASSGSRHRPQFSNLGATAAPREVFANYNGLLCGYVRPKTPEELAVGNLDGLWDAPSPPQYTLKDPIVQDILKREDGRFRQAIDRSIEVGLKMRRESMTRLERVALGLEPDPYLHSSCARADYAGIAHANSAVYYLDEHGRPVAVDSFDKAARYTHPRTAAHLEWRRPLEFPGLNDPDDVGADAGGALEYMRRERQ